MQPSDFSMQSAVDLGARKAALEREAKRQAEAASGTANPYAVDVTEENLQSDVLERSLQIPVILVLLANWSGEAKQVEQVLDRLAIGAGGQWLLAKVDAEASPQLAQALRAQGVPALYLALGGQIQPIAAGAMNEEQVRELLTQVFGALREQGVLPEDYTGLGPAEGGQEEQDQPEQQAQQAQDPVQAEAAAALENGDYAAAEAVYVKALEANPGDEELKARLAQVRLVSRVRDLDAAAVRQAAADDPEDVDAQCKVADIDMYGGKFEDAFDRLIATVRRTRDEPRDRVRKHLLGLFEVLPPGDPRIAKARRGLTSALF
ncbi:putative thioredoxin [Spinactinospora alkalitolerans]|uniref:Putative thioredoxin n=1 Tax=Spinactinospora alkalitolerans TaxID=687207 RepID=A0A852U1G9_9ACTN|nr:tetratricopeptide repeat protein [Spinactinospora alkalitolerans]NYE49427.1 putative thioredoxin [Spinactinospora alkalitolerans]